MPIIKAKVMEQGHMDPSSEVSGKCDFVLMPASEKSEEEVTFMPPKKENKQVRSMRDFDKKYGEMLAQNTGRQVPKPSPFAKT